MRVNDGVFVSGIKTWSIPNGGADGVFGRKHWGVIIGMEVAGSLSSNGILLRWASNGWLDSTNTG